MPLSIFEHVDISVRVAGSKDRPATNGAVSVGGFSWSVIDGLFNFLVPHDLCDTIFVLSVLECDAAADGFGARDAVYLFAYRAYEVASAAGRNLHTKVVILQILDQFHHWFVGELLVRYLETVMLCVRQEFLCVSFEFFSGDIGKYLRESADYSEETGWITLRIICCYFTKPGHIFLVNRFERLTIAHLRLRRSHLTDPTQSVHKLNVHRFLTPQRTIVVKSCNTLDRRYVVWIGFVGHGLHEIKNSLLLRCFVPQR